MKIYGKTTWICASVSGMIVISDKQGIKWSLNSHDDVTNGNIFRLIGPLWGKLPFTGWFPHKGQRRVALIFYLIKYLLMNSVYYISNLYRFFYIQILTVYLYSTQVIDWYFATYFAITESILLNLHGYGSCHWWPVNVESLLSFCRSASSRYASIKSLVTPGVRLSLKTENWSSLQMCGKDHIMTFSGVNGWVKVESQYWQWHIVTAMDPEALWRHRMEVFSAILALCARNSPVTDEFPSQRTSNAHFDVSLMWVYKNC